MPIIVMFLLVLAAVLELLAAIGVPSPPRFGLMAGGLFFYFLALLVQQVPLLPR
jgi:hypothetical protein